MHQKFPNSNNTSHQSRSLNVVIDSKICMENVNELNATDVISITKQLPTGHSSRCNQENNQPCIVRR